MRPDPLVPSPRRTLATLAALLISAALSLGFAPLSPSLLLGDDGAASTLAKEPCDAEKVSAAGAAVSTSSSGIGPAGSADYTDNSTAAPKAAVASAREQVPGIGTVAKIPTAAPVGILQDCEGVRPGGVLMTPPGGICTYNFVFTDRRNQRYIGTAGHCVIETPAVHGDLERIEHTWAAGQGPVARDYQTGQRIGEFAYAVRHSPSDFALIRIDTGVPVNPAMCHFGGPTGINNELVEGLTTLHYYGNGVGLGALAPARIVAPARTAVANGMTDPNVVSAYGVANFGDSGAGVISSDGRAVGSLVGGSVGLSTVTSGPLNIPRLAPLMAQAEDALRMSRGELKLVTAPLE